MSSIRIAGVDEAGRGALAGPVVASAVILREKSKIQGLADSKTLARRKREQLMVEIQNHCICWSVGHASVEEIEELNILHATMLAMKRAIESLALRPEKVLVDGNRVPIVDIPTSAIINGDQSVPVISAASVIAKETRDTFMRKLAKAYPQYGFESHVGYGTSVHLEALSTYGPSPVHRRSFAPVRKALQSQISGLQS